MPLDNDSLPLIQDIIDACNALLADSDAVSAEFRADRDAILDIMQIVERNWQQAPSAETLSEVMSIAEKSVWLQQLDSHLSSIGVMAMMIQLSSAAPNEIETINYIDNRRKALSAKVNAWLSASSVEQLIVGSLTFLTIFFCPNENIALQHITTYIINLNVTICQA